MSLIDRTLLFLGLPIPFGNICCIYPLTIKQIYDKSLGRDKYYYYLNTLIIEELDIQERFEKSKLPYNGMSPLEFLLKSAETDDRFFIDLTDAFSTFIREKVVLLPESNKIIIGDPIEKRIIDSSNFGVFQNILRSMHKLPLVGATKKENKLERKFRLKREQRERAKRKKNNGAGLEFDAMLSSLCGMNMGVTPFNIQDLTIYTVKDLFERGQAKISYEQDIRALLAGADSKKIHPDYWVVKTLDEN